MRRTYSLYEAKARLSEIIRAVRERGETVTVTWHGEPVAEIRPVETAAEEAWMARLAELERRGVVQRFAGAPRLVKAAARRRGALRRFLDERDG